MALYRLLREKQTIPDLPVDEAVRDQLKDLDLACRWRLLRLRLAWRDRKHVVIGRRPPRRRDRLEMLRVLSIAIQNCVTLRWIHVPGIGARSGCL